MTLVCNLNFVLWDSSKHFFFLPLIIYALMVISELPSCMCFIATAVTEHLLLRLLQGVLQCYVRETPY